jgi:hypothetical protein
MAFQDHMTFPDASTCLMQSAYALPSGASLSGMPPGVDVACSVVRASRVVYRISPFPRWC